LSVRHLARERPLHRDHRVVGGAIDDLDVLARVVDEPGEVALVVAGVGDRQIAVGLEAVGDQVVEHTAVLSADHRVLGAADRDSPDVVGAQPREQRQRAWTARFDLPHVRDVEGAGGRADGEMLGDRPVVLDRHLPAGKGSHAGAELDMGVAEGRVAKWRWQPRQR